MEKAKNDNHNYTIDYMWSCRSFTGTDLVVKEGMEMDKWIE